ncbi:MAG TPA: hypothetical protein VHN37_03715 [Actinomycetota bacterium]|nr:hypothetical protein [Actinomycetota bacterium]
MATPIALAEEVVTAAGTVLVRGSVTGSASLEISQDTHLSLNYFDDSGKPGPTFSSGSGLAAVVLTPATESGAARALSAVRLPKAPGQVQRLVSFGPKNCMLDATGCPVAAGEYRLFLVTESNVTVRLEFEGLAGRATVRPTEPVSGSIARPAPEYSYGLPYTVTGLNAVGAGFSADTTGRAIVFSAFWFRGAREGVGPVSPADKPLAQVGFAGACAYFDRPPAVGAFAPGCPGGSEVGTFATQRVFDDFGFLQWNQLGGVAPGTYGLGNYAVHSGIFDPGFVGFWIDAS